WEIKMLYDGGCPLCMREVNMLKRRDEGKGKIYFVDVDAPDYRPEDNAGISYEQAMESIHGILPDQRVVTNVEVFRRLYDAVGLGWVYAITKVQPIGRMADWVYGIWAKYRLPITGRPDLEVVLQQKKTCK
ncbi:putative thiol-disulfide oxidoreductase DCC, partial [Coccomyxa subellipsoidea C-169]